MTGCKTKSRKSSLTMSPRPPKKERSRCKYCNRARGHKSEKDALLQGRKGAGCSVKGGRDGEIGGQADGVGEGERYIIQGEYILLEKEEGKIGIRNRWAKRSY